MADFDSAIIDVLKNEGGLNDQNAENDLGGLTNFGISLRFLKHLSVAKLREYGIWDHEVTELTIEDLTIDQAKKIYKGEFWDISPFDHIDNQIIANYVFDMCINFGIAQGIKILQRSLWATLRQYKCVFDDGILGPKTLEAVNTLDITTLPALCAERAGFYRLIAATRPAQDKNLNGWLQRAYRIS